MKRCPQCHRVEPDEALKFCRVDGALLITEASSVDQEAGTVRLGAGGVLSDAATGSLSETTRANISRTTASTIVLSPPSGPTTFNEFHITTRTRLNKKAYDIAGPLISKVRPTWRSKQTPG